LLVGSLLTGAILIVANGIAEAHLSFDSPLYQYAGGACQNTPMGDGDWVNIVFVGARNQSEIQKLMTRHLGWRTGQGGSIACFKDHGALEPEDGTMASHSSIQERWHIRFNKSADTSDFLAAVHYDECNANGGAGSFCVMFHDGTQFESSRDKVATAFSQANKRVVCGDRSFHGDAVACPSGTVAYIYIR
jgi:hypothetical protein